jgi:hypothetical protein
MMEVWSLLTYVSEVRTASIIRAIIALMMEAARTSETSVNFNVTTRRYIPKDSKLHTCCRENLKSHILTIVIKRVIFLRHPVFIRLSQ